MKELMNQLDSEGRSHGVWEWYRPDGTLGWREHWHQGKWHGLWEDYYPDGTLRRRVHWHHGVKKGLATWWGPQGGITSKKYYLVIR